MRRVFVLLAALGAISAEAPLPYRYDPPQPQVHHHHEHHHQTHDQLNGFRPSHGYPCPDGIIHHNSEGRITHQHFETSGEPILAQQLPAIGHADKQVTVNSQIAFGEHAHSHGEFSSTPNKGYIPPPLPIVTQQLPLSQNYGPPPQNHGPPAQSYGPPAQSYGPPPLPIQHQQTNFHGSGSIIQGVGKAPPPFTLNHHHHHHQIPIPVQQHRPHPPIRPSPQYGPPRQNFVHQQNFVQNQGHSHTQAISVSAPLISDNLIPPPVDQAPVNFLEHSQNQFTASGSFGSLEQSQNQYSSSGSIGVSDSLHTISTGSSSFGAGSSSSGNLGFTSTGSSSFGGSSGSSSTGNLGFTSIGSTHNFNHPGLDEGLSQVISETFANAGVGENVEKHIYVHVPPDDLEERVNQHASFQQQLPASQPKKHYKIIFIKAPNQQPSTNVYTQIAQQQAAEEKTLVYVLVKKPDEPTIQDIQQIQSTYKPSKPEVYFIKYKTHKEHEGLSHQGAGNIDLTSGNFQGSDLGGGIDIRGAFDGESNSIQESLSSSIIEPRIPIGNAPAPVYGPPDQIH